MSYELEGGEVTLHLICHMCQPEKSSIPAEPVGPEVILLCASDGVITSSHKERSDFPQG